MKKNYTIIFLVAMLFSITPFYSIAQKSSEKNSSNEKGSQGDACGNPSHDHSKTGGDKKDGSCGNSGDSGKSKDGNDNNGKDKDGKGGTCGNPSHDHSKDGNNKDGSCGSAGGKDDGGTMGGTEQKPTCDGNSFSSEITSKNIISETCIEYEVKVSYDGTRTFGLSHFTMAIPCGEVKNISNSENWQQVFGKDPTTGVYGLKIDNINGFGDNGAASFTVKFTWCSDASCDKTLGEVAYKAGLCIDYGTLKDTSDGNGGGTNSDGGGTDDGGTNSGGNGDVGGGTGGTDTGGDPSTGTTTCSTLLAALQKTNVSCAGASNGQLQVLIQDGQAPFTYTWTTGQTGSSIQNLTAGNYGVTVTDSKGNTLTLSETISETAPIVINESVINPSCSGFTNGSINLSVTGGSGAYSFAWNNGSTQQNLVNLPGGVYSVTITDAVGCSSQKSFTLTNNSTLTVGVSFTHPLCGQSNGSIDITPSGGTAPYTYLWSTGATSQDLQNGVPGTYSVKVTDAAGCSVNMEYALRINNTLSLKYVVTPTSCVDDASGAIDLTVSGGTAPYSFLWQDGIITEDRTGLKSGLHKVTVTDAGGCSSSVNINVFKKTFKVNSDINQPTCSDSKGSVTLTPVDGIAPYTYSWSNGDQDNSISDLSDGIYSVTITDASGCTVTMVFVITTPLAISATSVVSNTQCGNEGAYAIDLTVAGGIAPYSYAWSNGGITQDLSGLTSGNYSVQITDAKGCSMVQEIVVSPVNTTWSCLITQPTTEVVCKSVGNPLSTSSLDASSYQWTVVSSDNSWIITAGSNTAMVIYTAGNAGTSATFTLTITKEGCTKTCSFTTSTGGCIEKDNTGGGDPLAGDPCTATVTNPTTAAITETQSAATEDIVLNEQPSDLADEEVPAELEVSAYPNPFTDRINFEWTAPADDYVQVEIIDLMGRRACMPFNGNVRKGQSYKCDWTPTGSDRIYIYRFKSSQHSSQGKLCMK